MWARAGLQIPVQQPPCSPGQATRQPQLQQRALESACAAKLSRPRNSTKGEGLALAPSAAPAAPAAALLDVGGGMAAGVVAAERAPAFSASAAACSLLDAGASCPSSTAKRTAGCCGCACSRLAAAFWRCAVRLKGLTAAPPAATLVGMAASAGRGPARSAVDEQVDDGLGGCVQA